QLRVFFRELRRANVIVAGIGEARMPLANLFERRRPSRPTCRDQPLGPICDPLHIRDKQSRVPRIGRRLLVRLQLRPARETLLPREHKLRIMQCRELPDRRFIHTRPSRVISTQTSDRRRITCPQRAQQLPRLFFLLFEIQDKPPSYSPSSAYRQKEVRI